MKLKIIKQMIYKSNSFNILVSTTIQENHLLVVDLDEKIGWYILYSDFRKCFLLIDFMNFDMFVNMLID
jgi:hypothetical protein